MKQAERMCIKPIQEKAFADELQHLKGREKLPKQVTQLCLYLDEHGIIIWDGRIQHSSHHESASNLYTVTIETFVYISTTVIHERHRTVHNAGTRNRHVYSRGLLDITARQSVGRVLKMCVTCKQKSKPAQPPRIPQFSPERVSEEPPFTNTGLEFAGPLYVRIPSQSDNKESERFMLLFHFRIKETSSFRNCREFVGPNLLSSMQKIYKSERFTKYDICR